MWAAFIKNEYILSTLESQAYAVSSLGSQAI